MSPLEADVSAPESLVRPESDVSIHKESHRYDEEVTLGWYGNLIDRPSDLVPSAKLGKPASRTWAPPGMGKGGGHLPPWKCANGYLKPQSGISNCICCRPNE